MKKLKLPDPQKEVPYIHNTEELKMWLRDSYVIEHYTVNIKEYASFMTTHMNLLKGCFPIRECREYPIEFKFYDNDEKTHKLEFRHFMINMILWYEFIELHDLEVLNEDFIIDCYKEIPEIENYINYKLIIVMREFHVKSTILNVNISEILYMLRKISVDFSLILGLNFSANTFFNMYENNDEIRDIMEVTFDKHLQPHDIEQKIQQLQDREIEIFKSDPKNPLGVILKSNTGIKQKQLAEFTIAEGLKPTLDGVTIPIPIQNSTLIRGLDRPSYLYIDAMASRKSLIMNKKVMGRAGSFGKITTQLARTLSMSTDISSCDTKHLVKYIIKTDKHLKKLNGKYYKLNKKDKNYKLLSYKTDKNLIGKEIYARSAATCALGDCVCPRCIGATSSTNMDLADGIAAFETEEITKEKLVM